MSVEGRTKAAEDATGTAKLYAQVRMRASACAYPTCTPVLQHTISCMLSSYRTVAPGVHTSKGYTALAKVGDPACGVLVLAFPHEVCPVHTFWSSQLTCVL